MSTTQERIRKIVRKYKKYNEIIIIAIVALLTSIARLLIIHNYIDWKFLWGGDQIPLINLDDLIKSIFTMEAIWKNLGIVFIPQMSLLLTNYVLQKIITIVIGAHSLSNNVVGWISETILLLIGLALLYYTVSAFSHRNRIHKYIMFLLVTLFFIFNPWSTIDTFKSYFRQTSIIEIFWFIIISYYLYLIKHFYIKKKIKIYKILFIISITMIYYQYSPTSLIRGLILTSLFVIMYVIIIILIAFIEKESYKTKYFILLSLIPILLNMPLIYIYYEFGYIHTLEKRITSLWGSKTPPAKVLYPPYANAVYSFIGTNNWIAHSTYMPYHSIYERGLLAGLMLLWPIIGLGGALILALKVIYRKETTIQNRILGIQILYLLLIAIICLTWGAALNSFFPSLKYAIIRILPSLPEALPWGISIRCLRFIYIVLASYVIGYYISELLNREKSKVLLFLPILFTILLLFTALPIFKGYVFSQYYNNSIRGFYLPDSYAIVEKLRVNFYEHILLLPKTSTYAKTNWGWQGSVAWYHRLNNGILSRALAPYSQYTNWGDIYKNLSVPCIEYINNKAVLCNNYTIMIKLLNIKYIVIDKSLNTYKKYKDKYNIFQYIYKCIYNDTIITIYDTNITTYPFHILTLSNKVHLNVLSAKPYHIKARMNAPSNNITIVLPLLYSSTISKYIQVSIHDVNNSVQYNIINKEYKGLLAYTILSENLKSFSIDITFSKKFLIIYYSIIFIYILPLILIILSLHLYIRTITRHREYRE